MFSRKAKHAHEGTLAEVLANTLKIPPGEIERNFEEIYISTGG